MTTTSPKSLSPKLEAELTKFGQGINLLALFSGAACVATPTAVSVPPRPAFVPTSALCPGDRAKRKRRLQDEVLVLIRVCPEQAYALRAFLLVKLFNVPYGVIAGIEDITLNCAHQRAFHGHGFAQANGSPEMVGWCLEQRRAPRRL